MVRVRPKLPEESAEIYWHPDPKSRCLGGISQLHMQQQQQHIAHITDGASCPRPPQIHLANTPQVNKLCKYYGPLIGHVGDEAFHDFPSPQALAGESVEAHLRELGFGYRAKYIRETARIVSEDKPEGWLESLANPENPGWLPSKVPGDAQPPTYKHAHEQLLLLSGVGPKVADCICLMGLGWGEAVPVDTHMWQIAQRDYNFGKGRTKTFSKIMYDSVGDHFRRIWGSQAGWAHSVLFTANLKSFSEQAAATPGKVSVKVKVEEEAITGKSLSRSRKRQVAVLETVKVEQEVEVGPARNTRKRRRAGA
ncbi:hypothetical protein DL769_006146 [Monosporascus sp. CRB-8-3]|nr:hypothetical protein DL769_006146 [Monosporascus sp. CRB-8-3]